MPTPTSEFDYPLPGAAIAQEPVAPRHRARLLDTRDMSDHLFLDLPRLLRAGDLVVVNRTRVRPARLRGVKIGTGGAVEVLLLRRLGGSRWEALVRPARRLGAGTKLALGGIRAEIESGPVDGVARVRLDVEGDVESALAAVGEVPLPPYITRPLGDVERYQTIFADRLGSAAAPTAGLHFTPEVVEGLGRAGVEMAAVELQIGLATFRPIAGEAIEDHRMHAERYRLEEAVATAVEDCRRRRGRVVAIGTTVVRVLETCAMADGVVRPGAGEAHLYLRPGSPFRVVDCLVTNFHLPRSSLVVLVAAFMGAGWREAYECALRRGYRFLSFGDAMYAERAPA